MFDRSEEQVEHLALQFFEQHSRAFPQMAWQVMVDGSVEHGRMASCSHEESFLVTGTWQAIRSGFERAS
jgi:hypothetical protein